MMFATLDDLEGTVELVVFEKALEAAEGALAPDEIVLVRGRVDHKEAGKVCLVVQDAERFEPSDDEIDKRQGGGRQGRRSRRRRCACGSTPGACRPR